MGLLTVTTLLAIGYGIVTRRWVTSLAIGSATPAGAALIVGDFGIPTFYAIGGAAAAAMAVEALWRLRRGIRPVPPLRLIPGAVPLLLLVGWGLLLTLVAPMFFDGIELFLPFRRILTAGAVSTSNIAQMIYLVVDVAVVIIVARSRNAMPSAVGLAVGLAIALSGWRYLAQQYGLPFPGGVFDNSPSYVFIELAPGGVPRVRGIFSEPAGLATTALVAIAYGAFRIGQVKGVRRAACVVLVIVSILLGFASTSTSFIVGGVAFAVILVSVRTFGFLSRRLTLGIGSGLLACALVVATAFVLPLIADALGATVEAKVATSSFEDRSAVDDGMVATILQTGGIGVGVGSARGSSFLLTQLASIGVIGTILLTIAIVVIVRRSLPARQYSPVLWGLVALLTIKVISGPEISETNGLLWLCLGLLAAGAVGLGAAPADRGPSRDLSSRSSSAGLAGGLPPS